MAHGKEALKEVEGSTDAFFAMDNIGQGILKLSIGEFERHFQNTQRLKLPRSELKDLASLVVKAGLRPNKADVRRLVQQGGLSLNGEAVTSDERSRQPLGNDDLRHGKYLVIRVGKKSFALVEIEN